MLDDDVVLRQSWIWAVAAGPFVGSVLGVLVRRLPLGRPVAVARSACESCGRRLAPLELIPVVSYLRLRGRCAGCGGRIAPQHLAIEVAATALAGLVTAMGARGPELWADCGFAWTLLTLAWIDWDHFRLPDVLTLPLLLAGLGVTVWLDPQALTEHALAAALGYATFRLVAIGYRRMRGRTGLGEGDAKLLGAIGAWVGLALSQVLLLGVALCLAFALTRIATGRARRTDPIAFGPFLAIAAVAVRLLVTNER